MIPGKLLKVFVAFAVFWLASSLDVSAQFLNPFRLRRINQEPDSLARKHKMAWSIVPSVYYTPETNFGFLLSANFQIYNRKAEENSPTANRATMIEAVAKYAFSGQMSAYILSDVYLCANRLLLRAYASVGNMPYYFWGIGPDTPRENKESYTQFYYKIRLKASWEVVPGFYAGAGYRFYHYNTTKTKPGGLLATREVLGAGGARISGPSVNLVYDTRDDNVVPYKGFYFQGDGEFIYQPFGASNNFSKMTLDLRYYLRLSRNKRHILAFNAYSQTSFGKVPFEDMATVGGGTYLRGYLIGRFLDKNATAFQLDYRWYFGRFGAGAFFGVGNVGNTFAQTFKKMNKYAGGVGFKVFPFKKKRTLIRLDYAYGREGGQFYLGMNELF